MIAADHLDRRGGKLLVVDANGAMRRLKRSELGALFAPGDLVVANDAATLPASLRGTHVASGEPVEVRLAAWITLGDLTRFIALLFGAGDYRTRTEDRPAPPPLTAGDRLALGPIEALIERVLDHPRLVVVRFLGSHAALLLARAAWLGDPLAIPLHQLQSGSLLIFSFFMISDPRTAPDSRTGRFLFAFAVAASAHWLAFFMQTRPALYFALIALSPLVLVIDRALPAQRFTWTHRALEGASQ